MGLVSMHSAGTGRIPEGRKEERKEPELDRLDEIDDD